MADTRGRAARRKTGPRPPRRRAQWPLPVGAILLLTFLVYTPCLDNEFVNWDDPAYVTENPVLASPGVMSVLTTPVAGNYHPLTIASLALNFRISGLHPSSYHWLNLLLHVVNTGLVFLFVWMLSRGRFWTTAVTSLFFGVHPTHVESVAWVAERKDVLYAFFYLIALCGYLAYLDTRRARWFAVALASCVLSAASKPAAVVLPLSLVAIDYYRRRPWGRAVLLEKLPFVAISIAAGLLTLHAQHSIGATAQAHLWGPFQKVVFASYATVMYVVRLFVPLHLSAYYPYPVAGAKSLPPEFYVAFVALVVLLPIAVYLLRRVRPVLFGLAFFIINIALVLQLVTIGKAVMADRYTYLPYVGLFFAMAWWLDERPGPILAGLPVRPIAAGILGLLLPVSLVQTWVRCDVWQNSETLWNDTIRKYPRRIFDAYYNRGNYYHMVGRREEALADFDQAIALNPGVPGVWYNKGNVLAELNRDDSALASFERFLKLDPQYADGWNNQGALKYRKGDLAGALADLSRAIELNPRSRDAHANRGLVYAALHAYDESIADHRRAIALDPERPTNYREFGYIGEAFQAMNRQREAIAEYDRAIRAAPAGDERLGSYYLNRSRAWWSLGDRDKALSDAREARRLGVVPDAAYWQALGG